ncbi:MAG: hypothetical protein ISS45_03970 [Candidatus Omnitrophica bacterium]|nr:hypothetical protein [Candidatus Omnitrophota bacterium]
MGKILNVETIKRHNLRIKELFFCFLLFMFFSSFVFTAYVQAGSIVLKVMAVNPSKEYSQKAFIKAYLPKEAKPEDIIDKEDLEIAYDTQQGSYYVYGEYELEPSEVFEKTIEIRDVWTISAAEIESLRLETDKVNELLKKTEFADRINFIYHSIQTKLDEIEERQKATKPNPQQHISEYRHNLELLESVKSDLAVARNMLTKARPFAVKMVWKLMIFVLIFLGLLGISFYFLWYKQVKLMGAEDMPEEQKAEGEFKPKEEPKAEEKKKESGGEDIGNILGGK